MWLAFIFLLLFSVFLFLVFIAFADMLKYFVICFNDFLYPSSPLSFLLLFVLFPSFSPNTYCTYKGKESSKCSMIFSISLFIPFSLRAHSLTVFFLFDHFSFVFLFQRNSIKIESRVKVIEMEDRALCLKEKKM